MKNETMTSRERVRRAICHEPVDRMPIDLGVHFSTGISAVAYYRLREYLGLSTDHIEMIDCVQCLARVDEDVLDRFHIDTILLNPSWENPHIWNMHGRYPFSVPETFLPQRREEGGYRMDYAGKTLYMPEGSFFFDGGWPDFYGLPSDKKLALFAKRAQKLFEETDRFTMMMGFGGFFGGLEFACDMLTDPELCHARNEEALKDSLAYFDRINASFGRYLGAIEINSDLGMQSAPMCSPASYEEVCLPYLKRFCDHVHQNSEIKIFLHSCGSIAPMLPLLKEAGIDILNPVQISAANMEPKMLKEQFGKDFCFWGGGCNTQTVLPVASPEEIKKHVKELVEIFRPGSGFVFNQVHNIMGNIPPENIVAMLDTAYENA